MTQRRLAKKKSQARKTKPQHSVRRSPLFESLEHRHMMAVGPQLLAITPNLGDVLLQGQVRDIAPSQLTFRFDETQTIDPATLATGIRLTHGGADKVLGTSDDVIVTPGYVGIGTAPNEVVVRFAEHLPDNNYQILINGSGVIGAPLQNIAGIPFADGVDSTTNFSLDLGAQVIAVVPQPLHRDPNNANQANNLIQNRNQIHVYFNDDDLNQNDATNVDFYQLYLTNDTATTADDIGPIKPTSVSYDPVTDKAILTFASDLAAFGEGNYRLRIGNDQGLAPPPLITVMPSESDPTVNENSSFDTAHQLGILSAATRVIQSAIDPQRFTLQLPGGNLEIGHRQIQFENHLLGLPDFTDGVSTIYYNFQEVLSRDTDGFPEFVNIITEAQKARAREIFEILGHVAGVQFVETPDTEDGARGITVATGDLAFMGEVSNVDGIIGLAGLGPNGLPMALMDSAETGTRWGDSEFGGNYMLTAMHEILHLLNLGHGTELPPLTVMSGFLEDTANPSPTQTFENIFPGSADIIHLQHMFRPESKDIDTYQFTLPTAGKLQLETIAERLADSSLLDTVISLYDASGKLLARNDDYFSEDSLIEVDLADGTYYVAVTASGNTAFDLNVEDSGFGGTTQGRYELRIHFDPAQTTGMRDTTGKLLDGDRDGVAGGYYNFWFTVASVANTIYVDKAAALGGDGTISRPFKYIDNAAQFANDSAFVYARNNPNVSVIRIVGNGGTDNNPNTNNNDWAYEVGVPLSGGVRLQDGVNMRVPQGVTVMVDEGAIFKLRRTNIDVGSFSQGIDSSLGHLQLLGTPTNNVILTSYHNEAIGVDTFALPTSPSPGDWGGIVFHNNLDREEGRTILEDQGIFLNSINHAHISYGGGDLLVNSNLQSFAPIELNEARPSITFTRIERAANAAIGADPDSFEETFFRDNTYQGDYIRVGPDIYHNSIALNTINGLFIRIDTLAGEVLDRMTVQGRFDDDIVHVITEALIIQGTPGGPFAEDNGAGLVHTARTDGRLTIDPGVVVKMKDARIEVQVGAQLIAEGLDRNEIIFTSLADDRFGASGTFDTSSVSVSIIPAAGDWGGIYFNYFSEGSIDHALITFAGGDTPTEGTFAHFNPIEIHRANVRIANSTFEDNEDGVDLGNDNRNGRGINTPAVIFVRGAQPVIINNLFQNNIANNQLQGTASRAPAISIDVNSLNSAILRDVGRSRGFTSIPSDLPPNRGALIRGNLISNTDINGMVVRSGEVTTQVVWDDTDITHVVFDEIIASNHHTLSGLRLQSRATESLIVKLFGENAGFTAEGDPLEITDRVGGTLQIIGMPSRPVVLTSFLDDSTGAGRDAKGRPQFDTNNDGINSSAGDGSATAPPVASPGPVRVTATTTNANALRDALLGSGIMPVGNATYVGGANSAGFFVGGSDSIGIPTGIILSTGDARFADGPNNDDGFLTSGSSSLVGDSDLDVAFGTTTTDTTYLEFDFVTDGGDLFFNFVFASEEYNEFVNDDFNDVFGFFLDGVNIALVPGTVTPVSINTVNNGDPQGFGATNPQYYVNNDLDDAGQFLTQVEYDGFTTVFTATAIGIGPGVHRIKLAIADVEDEILDSAVFLQAGTFSDTPPGAAASAGDWRSVLLDTFSNDRNVAAINEFERIVFDVDTNGSVDNAQYLGALAQNESSGDDNLRMGFEVRGTLARVNPGDVDVYAFTARPQTEVWIDIDYTTQSLDTVVELIRADGVVIARSDNSVAEAVNSGLLFGSARELQSSEFSGLDYGTANPKDAGMRVILPGQAGGQPTDYFVRVRSKGDDINDLNGGKTTGQYTLQIRLREADELAGSTVRGADIRYANVGIEVYGKPNTSPLIAETADSEPVDGDGLNDTFPAAQIIGNLLASNQGTLGVAGALGTNNDVDWYRFDVSVQQIQQGEPINLGAIFDIDYADGFGRPDLRVNIFDSQGRLILTLDDSNIADDRPAPEQGGDLDDLSRGSIGGGDPFLGNVNLVNGETYYVAISHINNVPFELSANPLLRLEPINSLVRIVEDHIGALDADGNPISSVGTSANTIFDPLNLNAHVTPYHLGDVVMFVNTGGALHAINPFTGDVISQVGLFLPDVPAGISYGDIAMRNDGRLFTLTHGSGFFNLNQEGLTGNYRQISTENASLISSVDDEIVAYQLDPALPFNPDGSQNPLPYNRGVHFEAMVHDEGPTRWVWAVGNIPLDGPSISPTPLLPFTRNLLYQLNPDGTVNNNPADPDPDDAFSPTDANPRGVLNTGPTLTLVSATDITAISPTTGAVNDPTFGIPGDILDGTRFTITDIPGSTQLIFELDSGPDVRTSARGPEDVRDGEFFVLSNGSQTFTFEYESGPVIDVPWVLQGGQRIAGSQLTDGQTLTIFDNAGVPTGVIFEFNDTTLVAPGNELNNLGATEISYTPADDLATVVASILDAINNAAFNVEAEPSVLDIIPAGTLTNFGRITLRNDTVVALTAGGVTLDGARNTSIFDAIPINFEETDDFDIFLQNTTTIVDTFLTGMRVGYAARTGSNQFPGSGTTGDRMTFYGAVTADFSGVSSFTHMNNNGAGAISTPGGAATPSITGIRLSSNVAIPFDAGDSAFDLAQSIAQAINTAAVNFPNFEIEATAIGVQVEIEGVDPTAPIESDAGTRVNPSGDNGPGGLITGLAFMGNTMYAVSDAGGLYIVNNYSAFMNPATGTGGASLDYIETSADHLLGIEFTGLAAGPNNVEGGAYANMLFATSDDGHIYAFDTSGVLQPIFFDGATSIDTEINGLRGVDFSTLDFNLWHASGTRGGDAGHGINQTYDFTRAWDTAGGTSFYFGYEGQVEPLNYVSNPAINRTYDMPGGAHGILTSDTFSLADYSPTDQPVLYFNYFLASGGGDAAEVQISNDGANWDILSANRVILGNPNQLTANSGGWRQARIELGGYAGLDNLRLRFNFSTGMTQGDILRALPGTDLNDGDAFFVDGERFEFDMGFSLLTPTAAGNTIADGQSFTITGPGGIRTFEFNKTGGAVGTPIAISNADSAADVAFKIMTAVNGAGIGITARQHLNRVHFEDATALSVVATPSLTLRGNAPGVTTPGAQVIVVHLGMTAEEVAFLIAQAFDQEFTNSKQIQAVTGAQLTEASTFTINDGTQTITFEFDEQPANDGVLINSIEVNYNPGDSDTVVAQAIVDAINLANTTRGLNVTATRTGSVVNLSGPVVFFRTGTSALIDPGSYDDENLFTSVKLSGALLQTDGNTITITDTINGNTFAGPLPFAEYGGDAYGGVNNSHEGFFIDDIIIGFAERGEMVTGAGLNTGFVATPNTDLIRGPYDLEIRQGMPYTVPTLQLNPLGVEVRVDVPLKAFDTNDRLTNAFTLQAPPGVELHEGETFTIFDGVRTVTFEFDTDGVGASPSNRLIAFGNTTTATQIATRMRNAINAARTAGLTTISASVITGSKFVQLFGAQAIDTRAFDVNTINLTTESNDTIGTAVDSTLSSANPGSVRLKGIIGDNYTINSNVALRELFGDTVGIGGVVDGLDVDFIRVQLNAGEVLEVDVDTDPFSSVALDANLRLFNAGGFLVATGQFDTAPNEPLQEVTGEPYVRFVAPATGVYYIAVYGAGNPFFNPFVMASGDNPGSVGEYEIQISVGTGTSVTHTRFDLTGDSNHQRPQGYTLIQNNIITNSATFGIIVDASPRDATGSQTYPGAVRNLREINTGRLVPGVSVVNNVLAFNTTGGLLISGDGNAVAGQPLGPVPFVRVVNNTIAGTPLNDNSGDVPPLTPVNSATTEGNDSLATARNGGNGNFRDSAVIGDNPNLADPSLDVDLFRVTLTAGQIIQIDIDADENGTGLDPVLHVFNSTGTQLRTNDSAAGPNEQTSRDPYLVFTAPAAGVYYIGVSGKGNANYNPNTAGSGTIGGSTGAYQIRVTPFISGGTGIGIQVTQNASPTLMNNVFADLATGISVDGTSASTIVGGSAYRNNGQDIAGTLAVPQSFQIQVPVDEQLFINSAARNFYPAAGARIIDSSIDTLQERAAMITVTAPMGIAPSPILAPLYDLLGQFRGNDPTFQLDVGLGPNVFKDRGAIERADFSGPTAELLVPVDNEPGVDLDPAETSVRFEDVELSEFQIQIVDGVVPNDPGLGAGVDDLTIESSQVVITRNGVALVENFDYRFSYDTVNDIITLETLEFRWPSGAYVISINNSATDGVRDLAGNALKANQVTGETHFTILIGAGTDFGDAPAPFPSSLADNGARHTIVPGFQLGASVTDEDDALPIDSGDDGVVFVNFNVGATSQLAITSTGAGFVDAWVDFNDDGDWDDPGEQILTSFAVIAGTNLASVEIPLAAVVGQVVGRFRLSTTGGLSYTGEATSGEVEDYIITIGGNPWRNSDNPYDLNDDGVVDTFDLSLMVNDLRVNKSRQLVVPRPSSTFGQGFVDINGDGFANSLDLAFLVNQLQQRMFAEDNDRMATANTRQSFVLAASPQDVVAGYIGDNNSVAVGPGLDVDIIRLSLNSGDRLTIDVDAKRLDSPLDSVLRIFNASGTQLAISDNDLAPGEGIESSTDSYLDFIVPTTGVYYIGISSGGNTSYNPAVSGSGTSPTGNEGYYEVLLQLTPAAIAPELVEMEGEFVQSTAVDESLAVFAAAATPSPITGAAVVTSTVVENDVILSSFSPQFVVDDEDDAQFSTPESQDDDETASEYDNAFAELEWELV